MTTPPGRPWRLCYQALLPWALRDPALLREGARADVLRALRLLRGELDLGQAATDQDAHQLVALTQAYAAGWRSAVLHPVLEALGHSPAGDPWPLPAGRLDWTGRGRAFLPTVGELLDFFAQHPASHDLRLIAAAHLALTQTSGAGAQGSRERLGAALESLCREAWREEVEVGRRHGWDDAEWWDYLELPERVAWLVAGLGGSEALDPAACGELAEKIARESSPPDWTWRGTGLPEDFLPALTAALTDCYG